MKVVLLQDVKGIGRKWDVREVKEGYARNFLFPHKFAEAATPEKLKRLDEAQKRHEVERNLRVEVLKKKAEVLEALRLEFSLKVGEKGETFGSVHAKDIEVALQERGFSECKINLPHPLKDVGEVKVEIDLGEGVKGEVTIAVVPQQS